MKKVTVSNKIQDILNQALKLRYFRKTGAIPGISISLEGGYWYALLSEHDCLEITSDVPWITDDSTTDESSVENGLFPVLNNLLEQVNIAIEYELKIDELDNKQEKPCTGKIINIDGEEFKLVKVEG